MSRAYRRWTHEEVTTLLATYGDPTTTTDLLTSLFPSRTVGQIRNKANALGLAICRPSRRTREEYLRGKREGMRRLRERDPAAVRDKQKAWRDANLNEQRARQRRYLARRFFYTRSLHLRGPGSATLRDLASLWRQQRGLCALTGRRLDRSAQIDHIVPRALGGGDERTNLRWVCNDANLAKRALPDDRFVALCRDVIRWIGEQIERVDALASGAP